MGVPTCEELLSLFSFLLFIYLLQWWGIHRELQLAKVDSCNCLQLWVRIVCNFGRGFILISAPLNFLKLLKLYITSEGSKFHSTCKVHFNEIRSFEYIEPGPTNKSNASAARLKDMVLMGSLNKISKTISGGRSSVWLMYSM